MVVIINRALFQLLFIKIAVEVGLWMSNHFQKNMEYPFPGPRLII